MAQSIMSKINIYTITIVRIDKRRNLIIEDIKAMIGLSYTNLLSRKFDPE